MNTAVGLYGKVAVVTGASRGVGACVARELLHRGARTALVARDLRQILAVSRDCVESPGVALPIVCDLSDAAEAAALIASVTERLGPVDLLVNSAATVAPLGPTADVSWQAWAATIQLNLTSAACLTAAALPNMLERGFGRIVNVTSGAATGGGMPGASAYSVSKAGLEMFTRNLAAELIGTGVSAMAVRPGRVDTRMQLFLRTQTVEAVAKRACTFLTEGELIDPSVPAELILKALELGLNGQTISVYDTHGRNLLSHRHYSGDGRSN